jgi:hypothetical protein
MLENARNADAKRVTVQVAGSRQLTVADDGKAAWQSNTARVRPIFSLEQGGLGLAIARRLVES